MLRNTRTAAAWGAGAVVTLLMIGALTGCSKPAPTGSSAEVRQSFMADPSKMPPEARQKMMEAQQAGANAARKGQAAAGK